MDEIDQAIKIVLKLTEEIDATKNLVNEGDPFLLTRKDYLDNLLMIAKG